MLPDGWAHQLYRLHPLELVAFGLLHRDQQQIQPVDLELVLPVVVLQWPLDHLPLSRPLATNYL